MSHGVVYRLSPIMLHVIVTWDYYSLYTESAICYTMGGDHVAADWLIQFKTMPLTEVFGPQ